MKKQRNYSLLVFTSFLMLGACGHTHVQQAKWTDESYTALMETGSDMVQADQNHAAIPFYRQALSKALQADDLEAVETASYNLALSQLKDRDLRASLQTIAQAENFLKRHDAEISPWLSLVKGAVLNAQENWEQSQKALLPCFKKDVDSAIRGQALYIDALNNASLANAKDLHRDLQAFSNISPKDKIGQENEKELEIREKLLKGKYEEAEKEASSLVVERRLNHEYPAMREALSLEANALEHSGQTEKAHNLRLQIQTSQKADPF